MIAPKAARPSDRAPVGSREKTWNQKFAALVAFNRRYKHCNVPIKWPNLGLWVYVQRRFRRMGRLSEARIKQLDELGFCWDAHEAAWDSMYQELVTFQERFRHCQVPQRWAENRALGAWVSAQRAAWKKKVLSPDRIHRLKSIGFQLDGRAPNRPKSSKKHKR